MSAVPILGRNLQTESRGGLTAASNWDLSYTLRDREACHGNRQYA
jgi:hypothetical protein